MKDKFVSVIVDAVGNISSRRFRKEYFIKNNHTNLWNWFEETKTQFPNYTNREVVILLQHNFSAPPKCIVCGKNAKIQTYTVPYTFEYCSKKCSEQSEQRGKKISSTKKNYTQEQKEAIEIKRRTTNRQKYGVDYQSQRTKVKAIVSEKLSKTQLNEFARSKLKDKEWLYNEYVINKRTAVDIANELQVYYGTVLDYCRFYDFKIRNISKESLPQKHIYQFITSIYNGPVIYNDWETLNDLELDIYLPELKIAIEHNGLFSHSYTENTKLAKNRHLNKTLRCEELGIHLIHIRGDQWQKKKEIVKSMIAAKIGKTQNKIHARKCKIVPVNYIENKLFMQENHIQGYLNALLKYALVYNNEIVCMMTFSKPRYRTDVEWELLRYCNKLNTHVIGGFTKLLSHFKQHHSGNIVSYCDKSHSNGIVYKKAGFILEDKPLVPTPYWTNCHTVYNREKFQKYKLKELYEKGFLKCYDKNKTAEENMFNNKYRIIYDCGQLVFLLII